MRTRATGWVGAGPALSMLLLLFMACGPGAWREIAGERLLMVDDPEWRVDEFAISPDGRWVAVAALGGPDRAARFFLYDLDNARSMEAKPSEQAQVQLLIQGHPGIEAMEWDETGTHARFPAKPIGRGGYVVSDPPSGRLLETGHVLPENSPWFEVNLEGNRAAKLELNDSKEARSRPVHLPPEIDPRLKVKIHSRTKFDLLDEERGGRRIARIRGYMMWVTPDTATISPDGDWVGLTVGREAFGFKGNRGFLIDRESGKRWYLAHWVLWGLKWHPTRREVFGVSNEAGGSTVLMRWRY